jgi:hypothetical protein
MTPRPEDEHWRAIAVQASKEMDDAKLLLLVDQLCNAFDEHHKLHSIGTDPK